MIQLFLIIILPSILGAQTVSNLAVIPGTPGSPSTVTFDVEWTAATLPTPWLDSMWVFVDYNKNGKMERLLISGGTLTEHTATKAGTGIFIPENDMGAWVYGDARYAGSFSAKVELYTKETDVIIAGSCAYASSYPPVNNWLSDTKLGFTGTPMYEITLTDGSTTVTVEAGSTFLLPCSYTVSSFTDRTGAPGIINCKAPTNLALTASPEAICEGQSTTLTASATDAAQYRIDNGAWQTATTFSVAPTANASYTLYVKTAASCTATLPDAATVVVNSSPTITAISPPAAVLTAGTAITITGTNFMAGATVTIGGTACTGITVNSSTEITCTTPAKTVGAYPVVVTTAYCNPSNADVTFSYLPAEMQVFTAAHCNVMAINQVITLTDTRNSKSYHIIKLKMSADGTNDRCWMQENLAIAGTPITSANSNVSTNFTISAVTTTAPGDSYAPTNPAYPNSPSYDVATFGYLYNWATAIAYSTAHYGTGTNNDSRDLTTGNTQYSICPKGWRLPIGGTTDISANEFSLVDVYSYGGNGNNNDGDAAALVAKWIAPSGFAAVNAGQFNGGQFRYYGVGGYTSFWSASPKLSENGYTYALGINDDFVIVVPTQDIPKQWGFSIRCILN